MKLFKARALPDAPKILLIQTANPDLTGHVLSNLSDRYPTGTITLLRQRNMESFLSPPARVRVIDNVNAGRLQLALGLRNEKYDLICTIRSGEPGFWKLKLLPFCCHPGDVLVFNRNAQPEPSGFFPLFRKKRKGFYPLSVARKALTPFLYLYFEVVFRMFSNRKINRSRHPGPGRW